MTSPAPAPADVEGRVIQTGDTVVFAGLVATSAVLLVGHVEEIDLSRATSVLVYEHVHQRREWRRPRTLAVSC